MLALVVFGGIIIGVFVFAAGMVVGRSTANSGKWPTTPKVTKHEDEF